MKPVEYIRWIDSVATYGGWHTIESMKADVRMECHSVGYVFEETEDYVLLVSHWHPEQEYKGNEKVEMSGCGDMAIPKVAIVERRVIMKEGTVRNAMKKGQKK